METCKRRIKISPTLKLETVVIKTNDFMEKINLNDKKFITTENNKGLSSSETVFHYKQTDMIITGSYKGGAIVEGSIVGKQTDKDSIELLFQCLTDTGELKAGQSQGKISIDKYGKLGLKFEWSWLNGDKSGGQSEYIEI